MPTPGAAHEQNEGLDIIEKPAPGNIVVQRAKIKIRNRDHVRGRESAYFCSCHSKSGFLYLARAPKATTFKSLISDATDAVGSRPVVSVNDDVGDCPGVIQWAQPGF